MGINILGKQKRRKEVRDRNKSKSEIGHRYIFIFIGVLTVVIFSSIVSDVGMTHSGRKVLRARFLRSLNSLKIPFIANKGQVNRKVAYYAQTFSGTVYITNEGEIVYNLPLLGKYNPFERTKIGKGDRLDTCARGVALREKLTGNRIRNVTGYGPTHTHVSYFVGRNPKVWSMDLPTYSRISLGEVYPEVVLTLVAHGNNIEKVFTVHPGGNPENIQIKLEGGKITKVKDGQLVVKTPLGEIGFTAPAAYQEIKDMRQPVKISYKVCGNGVYGFEIGVYNPRYPLVIDPILASTFLGGSDWEKANALVLGNSGDIYVAGYTWSNDFPTTAGVYEKDYNGNDDVFISMLSGDLKRILASTFLGGNNVDEAFDLTLDDSGNVYVVGHTDSKDFPTTTGAYDESFNGGWDIFISKLSGDLKKLHASTLLGGSTTDCGNALVLDGAGDVYVAGETESNDFPATTGAYDESFNGGWDVFISKLSGDLKKLLASTYFGGDNSDGSLALSLDNSGDIYVAGWTGSFNIRGIKDADILKLNGNLSKLLAYRFFGGKNKDEARALTLDGSGHIYVAGWTKSAHFPVLGGDYKGGANDAFVSKLKLTGEDAVFASVLSLKPVRNAFCGLTLPLWAQVRNTGSVTLPSNARVWFWVNYPNSKELWVGSVSVGGLPVNATNWFFYSWALPSKAKCGSYSYKAQVWIGKRAISTLKGPKNFTVSRGSTAFADIKHLKPVEKAKCGTPSTLWAEVKNTGDSSLPPTARVWFYVTGPSWSGTHWVGSTSVAGLESHASQWYSYVWVIPLSTSPGKYAYKARVYDDHVAISAWKGTEGFMITCP